MNGISRGVRATATAACAAVLLYGAWGFLTAVAQSAAWGIGARTAFVAPSFTGPATAIASSVAMLGMAELVTWAAENGRLRDIPSAIARSLRRITLGLVRALGLTRLTRRGMLLAALATVLALASNIGVNALVGLPTALDDPRYVATASLTPFDRGLVLALIGAPEELLLRGPVLITLALTAGTTSRGWRSAAVGGVLIATSLIFGALHPGLDNMISAAINGLIWGSLSLLTRSLWPAVLSHAAHNLVVGLIT